MWWSLATWRTVWPGLKSHLRPLMVMLGIGARIGRGVSPTEWRRQGIDVGVHGAHLAGETDGPVGSGSRTSGAQHEGRDMPGLDPPHGHELGVSAGLVRSGLGAGPR